MPRPLGLPPPSHRPLMEIDHYGELLIGCIECNRWGHPDDQELIMQLLEADLEALRGSKKPSEKIRGINKVDGA
jgi:hypothetical protein